MKIIRGTTLVELAVTLAAAGIIGLIAAQLVSWGMRTYGDLARRHAILDARIDALLRLDCYRTLENAFPMTPLVFTQVVGRAPDPIDCPSGSAVVSLVDALGNTVLAAPSQMRGLYTFRATCRSHTAAMAPTSNRISLEMLGDDGVTWSSTGSDLNCPLRYWRLQETTGSFWNLLNGVFSGRFASTSASPGFVGPQLGGTFDTQVAYGTLPDPSTLMGCRALFASAQLTNKVQHVNSSPGNNSRNFWIPGTLTWLVNQGPPSFDQTKRVGCRHP